MTSCRASLMLRLNKCQQGDTGPPVLVDQSRAYLLAVRFVERNQKGNYFRDTQLFGAKRPRLVHRLALVQRCPERFRYFRTVPNRTHISDGSPPSIVERPKTYLGESLPLTGTYRIISVSKLILKIDRMIKCSHFAHRLRRLVGLCKI